MNINNFTIVELDTPNKFVIYDSKGRSIFLNNTTKEQVYEMANKIFKEKDAKIQEELENEITPNKIKIPSEIKKKLQHSLELINSGYEKIKDKYLTEYKRIIVSEGKRAGTEYLKTELKKLSNNKPPTIEKTYLKYIHSNILLDIIKSKSQIGGAFKNNNFYYIKRFLMFIFAIGVFGGLSYSLFVLALPALITWVIAFKASIFVGVLKGLGYSGVVALKGSIPIAYAAAGVAGLYGMQKIHNITSSIGNIGYSRSIESQGGGDLSNKEVSPKKRELDDIEILKKYDFNHLNQNGGGFKDMFSKSSKLSNKIPKSYTSFIGVLTKNKDKINDYVNKEIKKVLNT